MKWILLNILLLSAVSLTAQISVRNVDLIEGAPNVLYVWLNNTVEIFGLDSADFRDLKTSKGTIYPMHNEWNGFTVKIRPEDRTDTTTLTIRTKGLGTVRKGFAVRKPSGEIHVSLGLLLDTIATIDEILADPTLHVGMPDSYLKEWWWVSAYSLDLTSPSGSVMARFGNPGNTMTQSQIDVIELLEPGDMLRFTNIKATCPDCQVRNLGDMTIHIK